MSAIKEVAVLIWFHKKHWRCSTYPLWRGKKHDYRGKCRWTSDLALVWSRLVVHNCVLLFSAVDVLRYQLLALPVSTVLRLAALQICHKPQQRWQLQWHRRRRRRWRRWWRWRQQHVNREAIHNDTSIFHPHIWPVCAEGLIVFVRIAVWMCLNF